MRSISCSLPRAGIITRDLGPHRGRGCGAGEGGDRAQAAPPGRDQAARAALPPAARRAAASGGAAVPPGHGVEAGKGESERGLLQRPQEDGHGWCSCAGQAGSSRRLPQASAHPKARAQAPAAGAGRRLTACRPHRGGQDRREPERGGD